MEGDSQRFLEELRRSAVNSHGESSMVGDDSVQPATCALCQRTIVPENEATGDFETINMCGDCKFLYLEDLGTPTRDSYHRRSSARRRARNSSSESLENIFSQQFSHMINLVRQNQSPGSGVEDLSVDGDPASRITRRTSSRTTPNGSRRWRRVLSDTESDDADSLYGESESNVSFGRYRVSHGESDTISFSAYGGDSDISVDLHGFLDTERIIQPDDESSFDSSDTDIDPMHAALDPWNSDDHEEEDDDDDDEEEEDEEEDDEWEEADTDENIVESREASGRLRNLLVSSPGRSNRLGNWRQQTYSPESEGMIRWRMRGRSQIYIPNTFPNLEETDLLPFAGNFGDYLDSGGFEELLQHLAEAESLRRGAPPTSVSFVNNLPCVVISKEHDKHDDLACAICKDVLSIGTEVNQLPCSHLYHPSCIFPWLSSRNTCPLCRYELPTDDRDYEEVKQNISIRVGRQRNASEDISSGALRYEELDYSERMEPSFPADTGLEATNRTGGENSRGRWLLLAAAPIVSFVGIVLVLWLGSPRMERSGLAVGQNTFASQARHQSHVTGALLNHRENRSRRWWSLF